MDDILDKVHEAGLTLKAGCVAPDTLVCTEKGYVTAKQAVIEKHQQILSYDKKAHCFEMRSILKHMTTHVPQNENIEIESHLGTLTTSIKHPVLVYRDDKLQYVRADEINFSDALIHHQLNATADKKSILKAWFSGAHLGDGSAYEKKFTYAISRQKWQQKALLKGKRLVFKIRAAEREVVERYALFFEKFYNCHAKVVSTVTINNTPVWDFSVSSFKASAASTLIDEQIGKKTPSLKVPKWIKINPEKYFLPFLAGLIDTDGTVNREHGSAILSCQNKDFTYEIQSLLALFGIHGGITHRKPRSHTYNNHLIKDSGGYMLKISDSEFLVSVAKFMADSGKKRHIRKHKTQSGQYDHYVMTTELKQALENHVAELSHLEKQSLGIYHARHLQKTISRIYLNRWLKKFPDLKAQIGFVRTLRPVKAIKRDLNIEETFYDFTVDTHNNYCAGNNGLMTIHNCGIGYEFSTLRPKDAYVSGAGAYTSGPLSFMDIYDKMCFTVSSAGGRRGAQMATFDICHPDVVDFIRAKREDGRLRQFNLSLLITSEFIEAVKKDAEWYLSFPVTEKEVTLDQLDLNNTQQIIWRELPETAKYVNNAAGQVACRIIKIIPAKRLWDIIMTSTYDYAEPGFILIDKVNEMNNNWFCENIRATNPCGEQALPAYGSCLLGSINLTRFINKPFTTSAKFDWDLYRKTIKIFTRMLDNVVEINGLPLEKQREEIVSKRRHGMGYLGLGSTLTMLGMKYGDDDSLIFTDEITKVLAIEGWREGLALAKEKGTAPILEKIFIVTGEMLHKRPEMIDDGYKVGDEIAGKVLHAKYSRYMQLIGKEEPELIAELIETGARFTHATSIAPTGTLSLSLANNTSNGIEPSFAHHYSRNVIREGKKSKEKIDVYSFELLAYRHLMNSEAMPYSENPAQQLPDYFISADDVSPKQHVDIQAAAQKWIDSSISKTANVPTDYPYEDFKDIYQYAYEKGLKGCTTFRFNPEVFQGVLVKEADLENTTYQFTLEDGSNVELKGNEEVEYDGEMHSAANLFDALKEGYYGKF
ncbi:MAG: adenosylcobalamin-dependent ribonucleoside-diphosphate reductase [Methylococcales bacterium]|nr:adenosylcobalamin-dependent ribonucleoside-diphosphate reductase [Methylococcales bacterium]